MSKSHYPIPPPVIPARYHRVTGRILPARKITYLPHRKFHNAVVEGYRNLKVNYDMTLIVALAFVAICCQGMATVNKPRGKPSPMSLMILILADPGERKSPLIQMFFQPLRVLQKDLMKEYELNIDTFGRKHELWKEKGKAIKAKLRKLTREGEDTSEVECELDEHLRAEPKLPLRPKFLYEDITGPGLWKTMRECLHSAAVVTSEASAGLGKWLQQDMCHFNTANDGEVIDIARSGDGAYEIPAILSFLLMLQPELFDKHMNKRGSDLRSLGLFGRFLVNHPPPLAGSRFDDGGDQSTVFLEEFHDRAIELLRYSYKVICGEAEPLEIGFDPKARQRWFEISNDIEREQGVGGEFEGMKDHGSKLMDIISRVAACLHLFEGYEGDISVETLESAKEICLYSADYYYSQFVSPPEQVADAIEINEYLNKYRSRRVRLVKKPDVRNDIGKKAIRRASRFDPAFFQLCSDGVVAELHQKIRGRRAIEWIDLYPREPFYPQQGTGDWFYV